MSAGTKRNADGQDVTPALRMGSLFEKFRDELDEHYDRKERIVKASRDVTAASKKIIFSLQRVKTLKAPLPPGIRREINTRMAAIGESLKAIEKDVQGINRYRYHSQLRCLEELVEALSFLHYIRTQTLITPAKTQSLVPGGPDISMHVRLSEYDYLYGIFDLFGEMMRFATVATARTGSLGGTKEGERGMLEDIQEMSGWLEVLPEVPGKAYRGKMEEMRNSVRKVEALGYGLVIRRAERPKGWVPDLEIAEGGGEGGGEE